MNIKQAKQEIMNTLRAYLSKDELGEYMIPSLRQRPVLLMGPPGIGKTQIMAQIAAEAGVGLVAYTITHHTRQSAMGLPFIEHRNYDGREYSVTEYTMSEILGSVYELMQKTGIREGILFLDEINCVSETLAPMMLQFLQCKTFGNQRLPEGWLIVAAGNPPEYNKSVRDFDVVTLDRVKRIDVEEDFAVWKEYARKNGVHGAIISYLDIKKEHFYSIETTVDGLQFATARGWEDLSELIITYEKLGLKVGREVVGQYIQLPRIAKDFANYLELYYKYQRSYRVEDILQGTWESITESELRAAPFDEKLSVMGLLLSRLSEEAKRLRMQDEFTVALHGTLKELKSMLSAEPASLALDALTARRRKALDAARDAGQLSKDARKLILREINELSLYRSRLVDEDVSDEAAFDAVKGWFAGEVSARRDMAQQTSAMFDNAFRFLEKTFAQSQEMVMFVTEITAGYDSSWFVENFGCDAYFRHNKELMFDETQKRIRDRIAALPRNEEL